VGSGSVAVDFDAVARQHRGELHLHCYRMLASYDEAEDAVQETFLRAWQALASFDGANSRAWLYKIATNVCLDAIRRRKRQASSQGPADVAWLQPYPDSLLDRIAVTDGPDAAATARETIELAFLVAVQTLRPTERTVLLFRDVLGWPARDTAAVLDTSIAAANSALQRARQTLRQHLPRQRTQWSATATPAEADLVRQLVDAHERADTETFKRMLHHDIRVAMPPHGLVYNGIAALEDLFHEAFRSARSGQWRLLTTAANRQPATASYLRHPADRDFRPAKLDIYRIEQDAIAEIITFGPDQFHRFGLPDHIDSPTSGPRTSDA